MSLRIRMKYILFLAVIGVALLPIAWSSHAWAQEMAVNAEMKEPDSDEAFRYWLEQLRDEARAAGISDATLNAALQDIKLATTVVERDRHQFEFMQTFWNYFSRSVTDERIKRGRELLAKHSSLLDKIYAQFQVPPRYLIALWGLETNFGDNLGSFPVIRALATLAYDRRRSDFFRTQLLDALQIIENGHITPGAMKGSWAGAMGQMQFMPSTFIKHAIDFTGDGRKDIWHSLPDAFSSAANYLSNIGWRPGELWGREVRLPDDFDLTLATMGTKKMVKEWSAIGVRRANGNALPQVNMEGSILLPQGHKGPAFLVYDNFRIILQWNRSIKYAICAGHLADRIVGLPQIANGKDADNRALSRYQIREIQWYLNFLGFNAGSIDGFLGPNTQTAVRDFQVQRSLPPDGYPTVDLLHRLRVLAAALL